MVLDSTSPKAIALYPEETLFDWYVEKYRFYAECATRDFPEDIFWKLEEGNKTRFLAALPDWNSQRLDCLWMAPDSERCIRLLHRLATKWDLKKIRYWNREITDPACHKEWPMLKAPAALEDWALCDLQLCDWW